MRGKICTETTLNATPHTCPAECLEQYWDAREVFQEANSVLVCPSREICPTWIYVASDNISDTL